MIVGLLCAAANVVIAAPPVPTAPTQQVPGVYRQVIGHLHVTAVLDGVFPFSRDWLLGLTPARVKAQLDHRYVPETKAGLQSAITTYLIQDRGHLTLVDTGTSQCLGPSLGHALTNLRAAGYTPDQVDTVLLTHVHQDHACGLLDAQGRMAYPNATVWLSAAEATYWLNPANKATAPEPVKPVFDLARKALAPYEAEGRVRRFTDKDTLPAGVGALESHGHTPGHVSWLFDAGNGQHLLVWGDLVHYHAVQFAHPEAYFASDSDPVAAAATRRRMFARIADAGWWVAGVHLPFPGIGHVRREGDTFAWVPTEFSPLPAPAKATK